MPAFLTFLAGYVLSQFYRSFLAVIAPELSADLHLSPADLGNVSACWFAAFALAQFPVGVALDRRGPRGTLALLAIAGAAGALVFSQATGATGAMAAMALIGAGCSGALMGPLFVFARTSNAHRFAILSSLIIGLGGLGNLMGGTPLALAAQSFGWRSVFYGLAGINLLQGVLVLAMLDNPQRLAKLQHDDGSLLQGLKGILSLRPLWPVWPLMAVGYGILITERGLWVGPYLSDVHGLSPIPRGNVIFAFAIAISLGALAYGPLETWFKKRHPLALVCSTIAGGALGTLALMTHPTLGVCVALLCVFGFAAMTYGTLMAHIRLCLPDRLLGRGMTFANFLCMSGAGLLQVWSGSYVGRLKASGLSAADVFCALHLVFAGVLLAATLIYAFAREEPAAPPSKIVP